MSDSVSSIRNLGAASDASFAKAGITTATQLRELGAERAYLALIKSGTRPHFIGFYALAMGLQGRPWNDCQGDEKAKLRKSFDALKAKASKEKAESEKALSAKEKGRFELEAALDLIGVIKKR